MLPVQDILILVGIALVAALAVTVGGLIAFRLTRRSPMTVQLGIVSVSGVLSFVLAVSFASAYMYVSPHDLSVVLTMSVISAMISLAAAMFLGRALARRSAELTRAARALGEEGGAPFDEDLLLQAQDAESAATPQANADFARLASELAQTGRRLAESRAAVTAAEEARRALIAHISHDLRTPLAGVRAMAEALEDGLVDDPARYYRLMRGQVASLTSMVDDLFELSRIQAGALRLHLEQVSVADLVSDAVGELHAVAQRQQVEIRATGQQDAPIILGDARELSRVIANMLVNAVEHTPPGGFVEVSTAEIADRLVLSVANTGSGIVEADLDQVFEAGWRGDPARTTSIDGLSSGGLGLAIVQGIVEAHRGTVSVRNIPGGCRFEVELPLGLPTV
ncbi:sensor histidine kinase [Plantibacter sp. MPB07]|uniref:sensor histidine kinase n=1 Tax=Plantibacter sp. MPB07 TaxID=3388853 RepID=UPI003988512D